MRILKCVAESNDSSVVLARVTADLVPHILDVQHRCYPPDLIESENSYLEKVAKFPHNSFICLERSLGSDNDGDDDSVSYNALGYVITMSFPRFKLPALNTDSIEVHPEPDTLYIHDMAVVPESRGKGVAKALLDAAYEEAARHAAIERVALIAVRGADSFWRKQGFKALPTDALPEAVEDKLAAYGDDAVYMESPLNAL